MADVEITLTMSAREFQFLRSELQTLDDTLRSALHKLAKNGIDDNNVESVHRTRARLAQIQELLVELGS